MSKEEIDTRIEKRLSSDQVIDMYAKGCRDFRFYNLSNSDLSWAILERANLSEAIFKGADLWKADLTEADLNLANLNLADLTEIGQSRYLNFLVFPNKCLVMQPANGKAFKFFFHSDNEKNDFFAFCRDNNIKTP